MHFAKLLISLGEYYQRNWKISHERGNKNIYIEYV